MMNVAPISFCNKLAFNVRDDKYKTKLLEKIFNKFNIKTDLKNIQQTLFFFTY